MFGRKNRAQNGGGETASKSNAHASRLEVPQQIYNTVDSGGQQKRRFIIAGVLGLGLLVLLTFGGIRLFGALTDKDADNGSTENQKPAVTSTKTKTKAEDAKKPAASQQAPQKGNEPAVRNDGQPTSFENNAALNNGFVTQPL